MYGGNICWQHWEAWWKKKGTPKFVEQREQKKQSGADREQIRFSLISFLRFTKK